MLKELVAGVLILSFPASALAGSVILKNKDAREVTILVKRSNSTTETAIAGKATMELPGAPLIITLKKTKEKVEAKDGDTVTIAKGKLTKTSPEPEPEDAEVAPPDEVPLAPEKRDLPQDAAPTPEATPAE
jgi:hypothetical protein